LPTEAVGGEEVEDGVVSAIAEEARRRRLETRLDSPLP
jgi:hypothetical protein